MKLFRTIWHAITGQRKEGDNLQGRETGQGPVNFAQNGQQLIAFSRGDEHCLGWGYSHADAVARHDQALKENTGLVIRIPMDRIYAIAHAVKTMAGTKVEQGKTQSPVTRKS